MKEIKYPKTVEIIKTIYYSDDNNFKSANKEDVELYEAKQKSKLDLVDNFYMPEKSNSYFVFKINSRDDLLIYKDNHKGVKIYFNGFREYDIPEKLNGYFISHYDNDYDNSYYELTPMDRFIKDLEESIEEDRLILQQKEEAMSVLEKYKNEATE